MLLFKPPLILGILFTVCLYVEITCVCEREGVNRVVCRRRDRMMAEDSSPVSAWFAWLLKAFKERR